MRLRFDRAAALTALCVTCAAPASAFQEAPPPSEVVAWVHDTGPVANEGARPAVVISFTVQVGGARWLRLHFDELQLAGDLSAGEGSILRLTAHRDGAIQELDARHCAQWGNSSAYFNGDAVQVEVLAWPGTGRNRLAMSQLVAGLPWEGFESQCGPTDDRVLSSDPRAARLLPIGCTGWLIDDCNQCLLTAGHCDNVNVVQFNVPLSNSDGSLNHPPPQDQYTVDGASVQSSFTGLGDDWRYFGCFPNPNTGLRPGEAQGAVYTLALPPAFGSGQNIRITGYGVDDTPQTHNQVQQTHLGPRESSSGNVLEYRTDTEGGNSGSAVLWEEGGVAIGIHTNGGCGGSGGANSGTATTNAGLQAALADPQGVCAAGVQVVSPLPDVLDPAAETKLDLEVHGDPLPGSEKIFVSYDGGAFLEIPLVNTSGALYEATLPPAVCDAAPRYYFQVEDANCGLLTLPEDAPQNVFTAQVGFVTVFLEDDMESSTGWTGGQPGDTATTGQWARVNPNGTQAQPEDDHSSPGTQCWVTGQGSAGGSQGDNDVDGGFTTLVSPLLDLSGLGDPLIDYWRWYSNATGAGPNTDVFTIEISDDAGGNWDVVEVVGPDGPETLPGWRHHQFRVADVAALTSQVQLRFVAADLAPGSIVEAALDDFRVREVECVVVLDDCNGNGILDSDDVASGRSLDLDMDGVPDECLGDCNGNGVPDDQDIANGDSQDCNANALPDECELAAQPYCFCDAGAPCSNPDGNAGCANSAGQGALLAACGSDGASADDLQLAVSNATPGQSGLIFMGAAQIQLPFGDGLRCVGAGGVGLFRFPVQPTGPSGAYGEGPGIVAHASASFPAEGAIEAGDTWNFQGWYRDPLGPCGGGFNLTNGLSVVFGP